MVRRSYHGCRSGLLFRDDRPLTNVRFCYVRSPHERRLPLLHDYCRKDSLQEGLRNDKVYVFEDINPRAPTHVLIVPKRHLADLKAAKPEDAEIIGYCQLVAAKIGRERGIEDGYRTVFNVGPRSGQSVLHLHLHLLGGRDLTWPPG